MCWYIHTYIHTCIHTIRGLVFLLGTKAFDKIRTDTMKQRVLTYERSLRPRDGNDDDADICTDICRVFMSLLFGSSKTKDKNEKNTTTTEEWTAVHVYQSIKNKNRKPCISNDPSIPFVHNFVERVQVYKSQIQRGWW